jgi:hypothetical protein
MSDELSQRMTRLEDRAAIEDLVARYTLYAAAGRATELAALFAEDGVFHAHSGAIRGHAALCEFFAASLVPGKTVPIAGPLHVRFEDGGRARLQCLMATTFYDGRAGGFCGHYDDELVKRDGEWRFVSRNYTFYHQA